MSAKPMNILLLVDDNFADAPLLRAMFNEQAAHTITITHVQCLREAEQALATHAVDVIVLDLELPDAERLGAIRQARTCRRTAPSSAVMGLKSRSKTRSPRFTTGRGRSTAR